MSDGPAVSEGAPSIETERGTVPAGRREVLGRSLSFARHRLILPIVTGLLLAGVASQLVAPRYAAEARLWAESRGGEAGRSRFQIIGSREFARQIVRDAGLAERLATQKPAPATRFAQMFGMPQRAEMSADERALRTIESNLTITALGDGQASVQFVAGDPRVAADVANAFADGYLKLQQGTQAFSMHPADTSNVPARVIGRATPAQTPLGPTPLSVILGAGGVGLLLGAAYQAFARRRRQALPEEILAAPEMTLAARGELQHLPWIGGETGDYRGEGELAPRRRRSRDGELADLSKLIELRGSAARLVMVTGPTPDEGIAHCALALGRSLSAAHKRVVIVCLDVAAEPLSDLTSDPRAPGLTDLLFGVASFSDAIHRETVSRCHVIPPGRGAREADGLVAADRLILILSALEQTYDHVVVAAPPLGDADGAERIAALRPTLILVTQPGALATDAVQAFDGLAAQGFGEIAMVTFADSPDGRMPQAA